MSTYAIDDLTVIRTDEHGEKFDLNADGEPCRTVSDLADLIRTLREQGAYDEGTEEWLLSNIHLDDCEYCQSGIFADHPHIDDVPAIDDDSAWVDIAEHHDRSCEWVLTRAHRTDLLPTHLRLRAERIASGLRQVDVAEQLEVAKNDVARWERGEVRMSAAREKLVRMWIGD